jgi:hypothetical protein
MKDLTAKKISEGLFEVDKALLSKIKRVGKTKYPTFVPITKGEGWFFEITGLEYLGRGERVGRVWEVEGLGKVESSYHYQMTFTCDGEIFSRNCFFIRNQK